MVEEYQDHKAEGKKEAANKHTYRTNIQKDLFSEVQKQNKKFKNNKYFRYKYICGKYNGYIWGETAHKLKVWGA